MSKPDKMQNSVYSSPKHATSYVTLRLPTPIHPYGHHNRDFTRGVAVAILIYLARHGWRTLTNPDGIGKVKK